MSELVSLSADVICACFLFLSPSQVELIRRDYFANEGWETFLSYEDPEQDILVGLLRLRKPSDEVFRSASCYNYRVTHLIV